MPRPHGDEQKAAGVNEGLNSGAASRFLSDCPSPPVSSIYPFLGGIAQSSVQVSFGSNRRSFVSIYAEARSGPFPNSSSFDSSSPRPPTSLRPPFLPSSPFPSSPPLLQMVATQRTSSTVVKESLTDMTHQDESTFIVPSFTVSFPPPRHCLLPSLRPPRIDH